MNTVSIHQRRRSRKAQRWHIPSYAELRLSRRYGLPAPTARAVAELIGFPTGEVRP
jgi:hypothetical protein